MRNPKLRRARQRGYSLISLMVGLVISLLTIAAMLAVYKMVVEVSGRASADSLRDGQVASGLLAAQMLLHDAGYDGAAPSVNSIGLPDLDDLEDDVAVDSALIGQKAIAVEGSDKRIVTWRHEVFDPATGTVGARCSRLEIAPGNDRSVTVYYQKPEPCADIPSASWTEGKQVLVAYGQPWKERDGSAAADAASGTYLDMAADAGNSGFRIVNADGDRCTLPYAQQVKAESLTESPRIVLESGGRELFSTCLSNIVAMRKAGAPASGSGT